MIRTERSVLIAGKSWNPQMTSMINPVQAGVRNELGRVLEVTVLRREWNTLEQPRRG